MTPNWIPRPVWETFSGVLLVLLPLPRIPPCMTFCRRINHGANEDFPIEVVIAPPALYLLTAREALRQGIEIAAQNVFDKPNGAFTGEISAEQLKDSGVTWTLTGHSERRVILAEGDEVSSVAS